MKNSLRTNFLAWIILLVLVFIWGSSFILMKKGLVCFPPIYLGALRLGITFIFLLPFAFTRITKISRKNLLSIILVGTVGNGIPAFLFAYAQEGVTSTIAGILNSLTPLFALLMAVIFFKFKAKWYNIIGIIIGFAGTVGLLMVEKHGLAFNFKYGIFIIVATIMYALNANLIKYFLQDVDSITIAVFAFLFMGLPSLVYLIFFSDFFNILSTVPGAYYSLMYIAILGVVGSGFALILYYKLIKITNVIFAASVTYLMPAVAVFWGVSDNEPFEAVYIVWILIILTGVILTNTNFNKLKNNYRKD